MKGCQDGYRLNDQATGYIEACYFEDTKSPIMSKGEKGLHVNKTDGYDVIFKGCSNLLTGYDNIDGAKINGHVTLASSDWVPTQTAPSYTQHYLDKTVDVPAICEKYSGAGKVEIWKAYTDVLPTADIAEFDHAIKNYSTAKTYDAEGKEMSGVSTTGIEMFDYAAAQTAKAEYFDLSGKRLSAPGHGVTIVKATDAQGHVSVKKVVNM